MMAFLLLQNNDPHNANLTFFICTNNHSNTFIKEVDLTLSQFSSHNKQPLSDLYHQWRHGKDFSITNFGTKWI